ncbi:MAG: nucleoside-diphosphate sugar epimerase/dehydratase [Steroidobacteraceae bacterium]|nr:nucleoside-diphosphate sugar epimerase/dehydratase [Steroidobacteraceae bacterium]
MLTADAVAIPIVMATALALKSGTLPPVGPTGLALLLATVFSIPLFARFGLYRAVIRFLAPRATLAIAGAVTLSVLALAVAVAAGYLAGVPYTALVIYGALLLLYVGASRMFLRWALLAGGGTRVVIYGAGEAGAELAAALTASQQFTPVAFVDDNRALRGAIISGVAVHEPARLPELLADLGVRRVLLAMPVLSRRRRREILAQLEPLGVHVQTMPGIADLVAGNARVDEVHDVDTADLLGRDPVPPNQQLLETCIRGKTVMVTGAGGSIGSELCRQILRLEPRRLLLLEMSELALYNVERELRVMLDREGLAAELVALLGNAHHKYRVREILQTFGVETVYHAAAYKHVPIVEQNIIEGLHNNVISTWHAAEAALECKVETFVLISTDKAVNPTNVMGATKRFAEIVLQGLQQRAASTRFCMVRFGNVLESSGSVVPLFREQIKRGGPITVTHPDVIRYFMTIPEAAQLVIQAGAMARGGDVFVLDMGKPIRIADLARRMVQLSGLTVRDENHPDGDIEIRFTGLRPAEKLFEELLIGKNVTGTEHPMILRAVEHALSWEEVQRLLEDLGTAMRRFDCRAARDLLERAVHEYKPSLDIQDLVWVRSAPLVPVGTLATVVALESKVADLSSRRSRHPPS